MSPFRDRPAPGAEPSETGPGRHEAPEGSIEATLAGRFELDPLEIIAEAFRLTSGFKAVALLGAAAVLLVAWAAGELAMLLFEPAPDAEMGAGALIAANAASAALQNTITTVPLAGVVWAALRHLAGRRVQPGELFTPLARLGPILGMALLQWALTTLGFLLLIVPGIYLSVAYTLALPVLLDRAFTPWQALETSREVVTRCWFRMLLLGLLLLAILMASALLIVPLIWTIPAAVLAWGIAYRNLCGITAAAR